MCVCERESVSKLREKRETARERGRRVCVCVRERE